jgi:hypothetical protein
MARDYKARNYIVQQAAKYGDQRLTDVLIRTLDIMVNTREPDGCMSNSVALYVILRSFGYEPEFCYGLCVAPNGFEFYHAWLELGGEVLDIAVYGNSHFSQYWEYEPMLPVVFEKRDSTVVHYGNRVFDQEWSESMIFRAVKMSMEQYIACCPNNGIWALIFRILNVTKSKEKKEELSRFVLKEPFNANDK